MAMKTLLLLLVSTLSITAHSQSWSQITDYPGSARDDGTSFKIGNKVICGTGRNAGFNLTSDFYAFDVGTETWVPKASLPDSCKRQYATSFSTTSGWPIGFLFGGIDENGQELNDLWRYNAPIWGVGFWSYWGAMPSVGRGGSSNFVLGDKAYIIGGKNQSVTTEVEVWEYDIPNNIWTQKNDLPFAGVWRGISFVDDTTGYVGLGINGAGVANGDIYRYLPTNDQWELVPQLSMSPRSYVSHAQIGDSVYLYGGVDTLGNYLNTFERINLPSLTIDILTPFPSTARKGTMAFASHDDFYLTTGISTSARLNETWVSGNVVNLQEKEDLDVKVYQVGSEVFVSTELNWENIRILSMDGRVVKSHTVYEEATINVADLDEGIYLYQLSGNSIGRSGRLFISK